MTGFSGGPGVTGPVIVLLACLLAFTAVLPVLAAEKPVEVGQAVPEFTLPGLDGGTISFQKNIRGKAPLTMQCQPDTVRYDQDPTSPTFARIVTPRIAGLMLAPAMPGCRQTSL